MSGIFDSMLRISTRMAEESLLVMGATLRSMQSTVTQLTGYGHDGALTKPPLDGPPNVDMATAELAERLVRLILYTPAQASALPGAGRDLLYAIQESFAFVDLRDPRHWVGLPLQLPLSFGTLAVQQGLRGLYASQVVGRERFVDFMTHMMEAFSDIHVYLGLQYQQELERYRRRVEEAPDDSEARLQLGRTYIKCGRYVEAAYELEIAARDESVRPRARYEGTVAYFRAGRYREAVSAGTDAVTLDPDAERPRMWLWMAAEKLGGYPAEVPQDLRMEMKVGQHPPTVEFEDVAAGIGLDKTSAGRGTAIFDSNGDGYLDVVISAGHGGCNFYRNNGDGTFTDATIGSGLDQCVNTFALAAGDYNNDGLVDLYITRLGFYSGECVLMRNNGDGTFTNVTQEAGVACWGPGFTATWVDYDCDGYLDLFVANNLGGLFERKAPNRLFHNNGDGTFTEVSESVGLRTVTPTIGSAWGDYDNDGYPDLFLSSGIGRAQLYHNNGDGSFADVSREAGIDAPCFGSTSFWWDYDNDGWLDLVQFVWSPHEDVIYTMRTGHGPPDGRPLRVYKNNRDGTFTLKSQEIGIDGCWGTMSGNAGDFNNDGYLDMILGNGAPHMDRSEPPVLLEYDPVAGRYHNVTFAAGLPFTGKGHGANMADLAGDGRLCLMVASGGAYPGDLLTTAVYRPKRLAGNYLNVRLTGTRSNRDAIGARVELYAGGRSQHRLVSGGSGFGCLPYEQHFGLGTTAEADWMEIRWPNGLRERFDNVPVNTTIRVTEGKPGWEEVYIPSGKSSVA